VSSDNDNKNKNKKNKKNVKNGSKNEIKGKSPKEETKGCAMNPRVGEKMRPVEEIKDKSNLLKLSSKAYDPKVRRSDPIKAEEELPSLMIKRVDSESDSESEKPCDRKPKPCEGDFCTPRALVEQRSLEKPLLKSDHFSKFDRSSIRAVVEGVASDELKRIM
jgi:hypothetical protein